MDPAGPVTVVIHHTVKPGREVQFEEWQRGISQASLSFPGHLGYHVMRPSVPGGEYLVLFRFDSLINLETWEASATRREWIDKLESLTTHPPRRERHTGMEVWFTPPAGRIPPPRYKMVVVTFVALYPLISLVGFLLVPHMMHWPVLLRTFMTTIALIFIMTYVAMPFVTSLFSGWLYPRK